MRRLGWVKAAALCVGLGFVVLEVGLLLMRVLLVGQRSGLQLLLIMGGAVGQSVFLALGHAALLTQNVIRPGTRACLAQVLGDSGLADGQVDLPLLDLLNVDLVFLLLMTLCGLLQGGRAYLQGTPGEDSVFSLDSRE
jgi:hypothetical protein